MNVYKIPVINPELFVFWLYFYGDDSGRNHGERHFLEHLLLGSNSGYDKETYRREIGKLGDDSLFSAATHTEFVTLSGSYLIEDAPRVIELLNLMLNDASLNEEEIESEREIIVQEYNAGVDNLIRQCYQSLGEILDVDLLAIGTLDSIGKINKSGLEETYKTVINSTSCDLYVHGVDVENICSKLMLREGSSTRNLKPFKPKGLYHAKNENISSSLVMLMYDEPFSLNQALLTSYLSAVNGPLFTELREKQQLCYAVSAMETFSGKLRCPYLTTYGLTSKDPELLVKGLHEHFTIEDRDVFDSLLKGNKLNYARVKTNVEERLSMEKLAKQLGTTFEDLANWPTWEQFREYGYSVRDKGVHAKMIVERGQ
jgi:predicted Zn-dependent peptidase